MEKIYGVKIEILHIVGGGSNADFLCQSIADATGRYVIAGPTETTAAGNLIMQLISSGEINSISEGRRLNYNSNILKYYESTKKDIWDVEYEKFLKIINYNN